MDGPRASSLHELRPDDPMRIGRYRIEARIGEGGMGSVYLGRDPADRLVAVKVVRADLAGDRTFLARFHDEAANAQRVASFCTAQVLEHGADLGLAYMVTEYIDGPSLLQHVDTDGALSPGMLHGVAVGVAAALVAIHSAGLVHRDLKPSNVLLSISGPRVIDFGIARALDVASSHTRTGQVVGTPGWLAPEQITGPQELTQAVDVFAWGCLVVFAASGRNPFGTGPFHIMAARAVHAEPEIGDLPAPLAGLVRSALHKDPGRRPSARDLLLALVGGAGEAEVTTELGEAWPGPPPAAAPAPAAPPAAVPVPPVSPPPVPEPRTEPAAEHPAGPATVQDGRPPRRTALVVSTAAAGALLAGLVAGGLYLLNRPDGEQNAGTVVAFPTDPMFVRIDTARGWPKECHGDIGVLTPGASAPRTLVGGPACDILPERSPDGKRVAFTRMNTRKGEAWVMNADGSGARKVTDIVRGTRLTWSPDGAHLAYMAEKDGVRQIFTSTLEGRDVVQLTDDDSLKDDPMWSSTGTLVFWSDRADGNLQIYTLDPEEPGGAWTRLTTDGVRAVDPEWSPDGSRIAYVRGPAESSAIWVMNADGSQPRALITGGRSMDPAWSRDGEWLGYAHGAVTDPVVRAVRLDGTGDRVLTPPGQVIGHPNWS